MKLYPGATLGILGGGQLGRMFGAEALRMGYHVWVLDPDSASPAGAIASKHIQRSFSDPMALQEMRQGCDAITIEFENIPVQSVRILAESTRVTPSADCIEIAQDRVREKLFLTANGICTASFAAVTTEADMHHAAATTGFPAILKTTRLGYDGKGQFVCQNTADLAAGWASVDKVPCILEQRIELALELSVVLARADDGKVVAFPVAENRHVNGILETSIVPAAVERVVAAEVTRVATVIADALDYVGVLAVEFFIDHQDQVLVNEIAPRPHNSGHYTQDATVTSQFEQQVRMLCNLPAGSAELLSPVVMLNLLGERWLTSEPSWGHLYTRAGSKLHLYGKATARAGRKMGHINILGGERADLLTEASKLRQFL